MILVGILSSKEGRQARKVVIGVDWAQRDMLAHLDVKPATYQHRKTGSLGSERGINWL
jgi:hypothetical protein